MLDRRWPSLFSAGGAQLYSLAVGVATVMATARWLGPERRGSLVTITTWVQLFSTMGHLSVGSVVYHVAAGRRVEEWLGETFGSLAVLATFVSLAGWGAAAALWISGRHPGNASLLSPEALLGLATLPFLVWEQYGSALLIATGNIATYNMALVAGRSVGLALTLLGWSLSAGVWLAFLATFAAQAVVSMTGLSRLLGIVGSALRLSRSMLSRLVRGGVRLHLNAIGDFLFTSASILIVERYAGLARAGVYQIALQMIAFVVVVPQAAALILFSEVAAGGPQKAWGEQRRWVATLVSLVSLCGVVAWAGATPLLRALAGPRFSEAAEVFRTIVIAVPLITLSKLLTPQWVGRGLFLPLSILSLAAGLLSVCGAAVLVPRIGVQGAAISIVAGWLVAGAAQCGMVLRLERETRLATLDRSGRA